MLVRLSDDERGIAFVGGRGGNSGIFTFVQNKDGLGPSHSLDMGGVPSGFCNLRPAGLYHL